MKIYVMSKAAWTLFEETGDPVSYLMYKRCAMRTDASRPGVINKPKGQ